MNNPICYTDAEKIALKPFLLFEQSGGNELQSWLVQHDNLAGSRCISVLEPLCAIVGRETQYQVGSNKAFSRSAKHCNWALAVAVIWPGFLSVRPVSWALQRGLSVTILATALIAQKKVQPLPGPRFIFLELARSVLTQQPTA